MRSCPPPPGPQELIFEASNANSVAFNAEYEDMLCYSGAGHLTIQARCLL